MNGQEIVMALLLMKGMKKKPKPAKSGKITLEIFKELCYKHFGKTDFFDNGRTVAPNKRYRESDSHSTPGERIVYRREPSGDYVLDFFHTKTSAKGYLHVTDVHQVDLNLAEIKQYMYKKYIKGNK